MGDAHPMQRREPDMGAKRPRNAPACTMHAPLQQVADMRRASLSGDLPHGNWVGRDGRLACFQQCMRARRLAEHDEAMPRGAKMQVSTSEARGNGSFDGCGNSR